MWICSKIGFFSIVQKEDGVHVRARSKTDLAKLLKAMGSKRAVQVWPTADYRFRVILKKHQLSDVFTALERSIDYPNFKSEVYLGDQRDKTRIYHDFHQAMEAYQNK